jgi:hypothetical protein
MQWTTRLVRESTCDWSWDSHSQDSHSISMPLISSLSPPLWVPLYLLTASPKRANYYTHHPFSSTHSPSTYSTPSTSYTYSTSVPHTSLLSPQETPCCANPLPSLQTCIVYPPSRNPSTSLSIPSLNPTPTSTILHDWIRLLHAFLDSH